MLCLAIAFAWLVWRNALGATWTIVTAVCGVFLLVFAVDYANSKGLLNENTAARLTFAQGDSGRGSLALAALDMFFDRPLLGHGLGKTRSWSMEDNGPHNMFVMWAAEHGLLGLLLYPALGVAMYLTNRRSACFVLVLMAAGMFSHNLFEDRNVLILMALATAVASTRPAPAWLRDGEQAWDGGEAVVHS